jgi:hypothetical protein
MFLADHDMQHALERVQAAFPSFIQWTYANASDDERSLNGFSLWGQWVLHPEAFMARHFYLTFARHAEHWRGHLTMGSVIIGGRVPTWGMPTSWISRNVPHSKKPSSR